MSPAQLNHQTPAGQVPSVHAQGVITREPPYAIRLADDDDAEAVIAVEHKAARLYGQVGMPSDLEGLALTQVEAAIAEQTVWVAVDEDDCVVGFALCWRRGDALHLRELDVHPDHMRRGLGRRLVEYVCKRAAGLGLGMVTLTTYRDVPWNAALYRSWGFEEFDAFSQPKWLAELRRQEDRSPIGQWPRVAMARRV